jgi:lactoylglutathione lyase
MLRVRDLDRSLRFWTEGLGLVETRRHESEGGRFTLVYLAPAKGEPEIELTWNWDDSGPCTVGRGFGHVAFAVDDVYSACERLQAWGVRILRPPRDGRMAFVRSPDQHSVELLQSTGSLPPQEPWASMPSCGEW